MAEIPATPAADGQPRVLAAAPGLRVLSVALLLVAIGWCAYLAGAFTWRVEPDFEYFYRAGEWLLVRGTTDPGYDLLPGRIAERGRLDWYLPFVHRFMTLFAWMPYRVAGLLWVALSVAALLGTLWMLGRYLSGLAPRDWLVTQALPFLLLFVFWNWEFRLSQINTLTLLLMVGCLVSLERGRRGLAGLWAGLAALLKITPALLLFWLLLKREFRAAGVAMLTIFLAGPVGDLAVFRGDAAAVYTDWLTRAVHEGSHAGLVRTQREIDWRNQGLGVVLCRWLHPTPYTTRFDNDPRMDRQFTLPETRTINVASFPLSVVATIVTGSAVASLLVLVWVTRRPASALSAWQRRVEFALVLLAMLWLMPVLRRYHLIWMLPALSLLLAQIYRLGWQDRWSWLAAGCVTLFAALQAGMLVERVEAMGPQLLSVALLAVPLVVLHRDLDAARSLSAPARAGGVEPRHA
ncbi:MAG: DUF2029 domain-containing protein [Phycisphaerales bacterium]|nr:DUF2029 domain-containing protein [Phycisphaerales bacterium]